MKNSDQLNIYGKVEPPVRRITHWVRIDLAIMERLSLDELEPGDVMRIDAGGTSTKYQLRRRDMKRKRFWFQVLEEVSL